MRNRKIGKFYVDMEFFNNWNDGVEGCNLFDGFVPLEATHSYNRHRIEYTGYHDHFKEVPEGEVPPVYKPVFYSGAVKPVWVEDVCLR